MSGFELRRAANMARNNELLAGLASLPAATMSAPAANSATTANSRKTAVKSAPAVAERKSSRVAARPPTYKEEDLFPRLPLERATTNAAAKSKKRKREDDSEEKEDDSGDVVDSGGEKKKGARPSYKDRPEYGLTRLSLSELDLALIRTDYDVMRLPTWAVDGIHPAGYSGVKKMVRITNGEFDKLNEERVKRGEEKLEREQESDAAWVEASIKASASYEKHLAKKAEKAKTAMA